MSCKITVLCENTVTDMGLVGEHGFSALVETPDQNILFDTGQGFGLVRNAVRLRKDLAQVSKLVLSHGHTDHVGGIPAFLEVRGQCPVVAHPDVMSERYVAKPSDGTAKQPLSIGMPWTESHLTTRGARFEWQKHFAEIAPNVFITGEVPARTSFELGLPFFVVPHEGGWGPDPFRDDLSLVLKTSVGLVIVLGCAHAGVVNVLQYAMEQTGVSRIHAVIGGTHLGPAPEPQLESSLRALKEFDIGLLAPGHCTGQAAMARMASEFPGRFVFINVGFALEVD